MAEIKPLQSKRRANQKEQIADQDAMDEAQEIYMKESVAGKQLQNLSRLHQADNMYRRRLGATSSRSETDDELVKSSRGKKNLIIGMKFFGVMYVTDGTCVWFSALLAIDFTGIHIVGVVVSL